MLSSGSNRCGTCTKPDGLHAANQELSRDRSSERFLRALIDRGFSKGVIDILRITAGGHELGYLYNFVYRDRVSNYQSGFQFGPDGRYKPGLVAHYAGGRPLCDRYQTQEDTLCSLVRANIKEASVAVLKSYPGIATGAHRGFQD